MRLFLFVLFNLISSLAMANHITCPDINEFKGYTLTEKDIFVEKEPRDVCCSPTGAIIHESGWYRLQSMPISLSADSKWELGSSAIIAESVQEAVKKASMRMQTLTFVGGPYQEMLHWYCKYNTANGSVNAWLLN